MRTRNTNSIGQKRVIKLVWRMIKRIKRRWRADQLLSAHSIWWEKIKLHHRQRHLAVIGGDRGIEAPSICVHYR